MRADSGYRFLARSPGVPVNKVHIAADHAGYELREALIAHLRARGIEVEDHGAFEYDALDAYPPMCIACAEGVVADGGKSLGIVIGGSGNGEQMAANLVNGARAALIWSEATAQLAREHNDANIAAIGARQHSLAEAIALADAFIDTPFSGDERHIDRIEMLAEYEANRS